MSANAKTDLTVVPWATSTAPGKADTEATVRYLVNELRSLKSTISTLVNAANQATDEAPLKPLNGMVRSAVGGWATALGGVGLFVYKAGAWVRIV